MLIQQTRQPDNLTITLFDAEGDALLEALDAIVDPEENDPTEAAVLVLKQLWLKLHRVRSK